jgi:hypothetical protein
LIEGGEFRSIEVGVETPRASSGFLAFLDGTQAIHVVDYVKGIPIVWATVSAGIRSRVNRRLVSWRARPPVVRSRFYLPFRYVERAEQFRADERYVDTAASPDPGSIPSRHPAALMEAAVRCVQHDRERCETELAGAWCDLESGFLYADGSITSSARAATSPNVVGVIKTHRRLYAEGDAFDVLATLGAGCRTPVFRVAPPARHPVASWYVRIRPPAGHDALFGLVRLEASLGERISERADEISRWVIAEGLPLSLPDARWDKMSYGIRDTEEFLRAIS